MTKQADALLALLRETQMTENGNVFIDFDAMTVTTCHIIGQRYKTIDISAYRDAAQAILAYLEDQGYIRRMHEGYYQVLHPGFHVWQTRLSALWSFLMQSVLTPIIVTILTTLALNLIG